MDEGLHSWKGLERFTISDALEALLILLAARILAAALQWALRHLAETRPPHHRLSILRWIPVAKLLIAMGAVVMIVPILVEPTLGNIVALAGSVGLAMAFALKDFGSSMVAAVVTILENPYQPGDWIEIDGTYGEVHQIGLRAVHLVTPDDTEVIIPHSRLWSASIFNASSGNRSLLCVTDIYVEPDHDGAALRERLSGVAEGSPYRKADTGVTVVVFEKPWGTHYKIKSYVKDSREQFLLISDITVRAKAVIREMGIRYARAPLAISDKS